MVQEELKRVIADFDPDIGFSCEGGIANSMVSSPDSPFSRDTLRFMREHPALFGFTSGRELKLVPYRPGWVLQAWGGRPIAGSFVVWGPRKNLIGGAPYHSLYMRVADPDSADPIVADSVGDEDVAWGEAKEGVRLGVKVSKDDRDGYGFRLYLKNVSSRTIVVPFLPEASGRLAALGLNSDPQRSENETAPLIAEATVGPGESFSFVHAVSSAAAPWLGGGGSLRVVFDPTPFSGGSGDLWKHRVQSGEARLARPQGASGGDVAFAGWWAKPQGVPGSDDRAFLRYLKRSLSRRDLEWPPEAYLKAAAVFLRAGEWKAAASVAGRQERLVEQADDLALALAGMQKNGPWPEADATFRRILNMSAAKVGRGRRDILLAWKGPTVASPTFEREFDRASPDGAHRHRAFGDALLRQGWAGLAAVEFERANALGDVSEELYAALLRSESSAGDPDAFRRTAAIARATHPGSDSIRKLSRLPVGAPASARAAARYPQFLAWSVPTGRQVAGDLSTTNVAWSGGNLIYVRQRGIGNAKIRSLDLETGRLAWEADLDQGIPASDRFDTPDRPRRFRMPGRVASQGDRIGVAYSELVEARSTNGVLWLDAHTGKALGDAAPAAGLAGLRYVVSQFIPTAAMRPAIRNGIALKTDGKYLSGVSLESGVVQWRYPAGGNSAIAVQGPTAALWTGFDSRIIGVRVPDGLAAMRTGVLEAAAAQEDRALAENILLTALDGDPSNAQAYAALAKTKAGSSEARARLEGFRDVIAGDPGTTATIDAAAQKMSPVRWSIRVGRINGFASDRTRVYLLTRDSLLAFESEGGKEVWRLRLGVEGAGSNGNARGLSLDQGMLYAVAGQATLKAVDARTGRMIWSRDFTPTPDAFSQLQSLGVHGGDAYVANVVYVNDRPRYEFFRVAKADGGTRWKVQWDPRLPRYDYVGPGGAPPAFSAESVYFTTETGDLRAINRDTGRTVWSKKIERSSARSVFAFGNPVWAGNTVYAAGADGAVYAFNDESGALVWKADQGGEKWSGAMLGTLARLGEKVCFGHYNNSLVCLTAYGGGEAWSRKGLFIPTPPLTLDGPLWVAHGANVSAFDPESGIPIAAEEFPFVRHAEGLYADGRYLYLSYEDGVAQIRPFPASR